MQSIDARQEFYRRSARNPVGNSLETALAKNQTEDRVGIRDKRAFWFTGEPTVYATTMRSCASRPKRHRLSGGRRRRVHARLRYVSPPVAHPNAVARQAAERHEDLDRQVRELTEKNSQLQQLNRVCAAYIADIAHELRTSLLTLKFYVDLLAKGRNSKQEHYQELAMQSIEQLHQFVEDTLSLSRLEFAGAQRAEMVPVDLNKVIHDTVQLYRSQAECAGLSLQFESNGALPPVMGDPTLLSQVVVNLVTNAIKYTNNGWIQVKTRLLSMTGEVIMDITDSGIGIVESDLPYIFERFYRAQDAQVHAIPGTGLGLAIVKEIVTLHHGEITVDSAPGVGSRFRVRLPVA